ncbi:MAG: amidohydrolase family protein [Planctomycetota bacterium]|jgi:imidazolonepropionase-like amidohydrolase
MGTAWLLTDAFDRTAKAARTADPAVATGALADAVAGTLPLLAQAHRESDLRTILGLGKRHGLTLVIDGAGEAHRLVPLLKAGGAAVVLSALVEARTGRRAAEGGEIKLDTAARLHAAGVPLALSARGGPGGVSQRDAAIWAVRGGLPAAAAIAAVTSRPAKLLGVEKRVGAVALGRDADFCICTGDPLALTTRVRAVVVSGRLVSGGR